MPDWYRSLKPYKYQTLAEVHYDTGWHIPEGLTTRAGYVHLSSDGLLTILRGYVWDGASGPTLDTRSTMLASLVHDALYQLMRERQLGQEWRPLADELLRRIMLDKYRGKWRRWHAARVKVWFWALRKFAGYAAEPDDYLPTQGR